MAEYKIDAKAQVGISGNLKAEYSAATFKRIAEDAIFFRRQAAQGEIDDREKKRYARIIILLMAFYLESLSNLMLVTLTQINPSKKLKEYDEVYKKDGTHLSGPVRKFKAIHYELQGKKLTLNTDGIQDIFHIRNHIIAHSTGRDKLETYELGWRPVNKNFTYRKFNNSPFVYSDFTLKEADEILMEVKEFLTKFLGLLRHKLSEKQISEWWPQDLVDWIEKR